MKRKKNVSPHHHPPPPSMNNMMRHLIPQAVILCFSVIISAQDDFNLTQRPYVVLQKQNLVTLGSVLAVLLLLMIIMAVCVYKPLARR
ncbi:hypothetical protein ILYODFUR_007738 [Ilyodon furcidens]|uniref:Uncharacterized protein n=2 Tax=Goodeidae TaxID=28758 RepID=A0ABU7DSS3_9TELE|nr:hypothetical protein [Characodon lateralis]